MSVYAVNKLCYRIVREPALREQLASDPAKAVAEAKPTLTAAEAKAFLAGDVGTLSKMGANSFLLHQIGRWQLLGLDLPSYAARIQAAYQQSGTDEATETSTED